MSAKSAQTNNAASVSTTSVNTASALPRSGAVNPALAGGSSAGSSQQQQQPVAVRVYMAHTGQAINLMLRPADRLSTLSQQLLALTEIPIADQILIFHDGTRVASSATFAAADSEDSRARDDSVGSRAAALFQVRRPSSSSLINRSFVMENNSFMCDTLMPLAIAGKQVVPVQPPAHVRQGCQAVQDHRGRLCSHSK